MRTVISSLVAMFIVLPLWVSAASSQDVLSRILTEQGVSESSTLDCARVKDVDAEVYGEAFFTEQIDTESEEYQAILKGFPPEKLKEIYRGMGLQSLGCIGTPNVASGTPLGMATGGVVGEKGPTSAAATSPSLPVNSKNMSFVATWATIVWIFSALGFVVFMMWVTSTKCGLRSRKMAEGETDRDDKAHNLP